jgi:hypothetical protein
MLGKYQKYLLILIIIAAFLPAVASAESAATNDEGAAGARLDGPPGYKSIAKVRPTNSTPLKVKPYGIMSGFEGLSRYNPITWGPKCYLPAPAKGQFVLGPEVTFARIRGDVRRGADLVGVPPSTVNFEDHLGFPRSGKPIWSFEAFYQLRPRWGIRYSFTPIMMEATATPQTAFTFMNQSFAALTPINSKWERYVHRAGLLFNITHTTNSMTSFYADWMFVQDKLRIGGTTGTVSSVTWDSTKSLAVAGLEFEKCLRNYRGNTLALNLKGGLAFMSNSFGYEGEVGLNYMIPIKTGRFGFVKGGYRFANLKTERRRSLFDTTMDGAFIQIGFLF